MWFDLYVCLITKIYTLPEREFNEHFNKSKQQQFTINDNKVTAGLVKTYKLNTKMSIKFLWSYLRG